MQSLRFCMITTFFPPYNFGGDGVFVQRLSDELVRRGHHVEVIHCADSYRLLAGHEPRQVRGHDPRVVVHSLHSSVGPLSPLATQQTGRLAFKSQPIRKVLDQGFDVIHYHNVSLVGGPEVLQCGQGIKLYTTHEFWLVCPTHVLFKFNREPCRSKQCLLCQLAYRRPPQWWRYSSLLRRALPHVDAFLSPSRFGMRKHHEMGLNAPFVHLPYFLPASTGRQAAARPATDPAYFLFVGRLERLKGLQTLLPVFRQWRRAHLDVAGRGSFEPELRRQAGDLEHVHWLGYQSGEELQSLYRHAVALIVPSIGYDVSPQVVLESLRLGTPVIVRDLGGVPEWVEDSQGGLVYRNAQELQEAMERLLDDPALREELGRRGQEAYHRLWSPQVHVDRYLGLVRSLPRKEKYYAHMEAPGAAAARPSGR